MTDAARAIAEAARALVNAPLPLTWLANDLAEVAGDSDHPWWVAKRNMRATLDAHKDVTGVDGEQDER